MPEIASSILSLPFARAAELLAATDEFQTLVEAADATAALDFIDYPYRDVDLSGYPLPGAYLFDDEFFEHTRTRMGAEAGQIGLVISAPVSATYSTDPKNDITEWRNILGTILVQMLSLANTPKGDGSFYWHMTRFSKRQIDWMLKAEDVTDDAENPVADSTFRIGLFVLDWVT